MCNIQESWGTQPFSISIEKWQPPLEYNHRSQNCLSGYRGMKAFDTQLRLSTSSINGWETTSSESLRKQWDQNQLTRAWYINCINCTWVQGKISTAKSVEAHIKPSPWFKSLLKSCNTVSHSACCWEAISYIAHNIFSPGEIFGTFAWHAIAQRRI